jgi:hypothetical protein
MERQKLLDMQKKLNSLSLNRLGALLVITVQSADLSGIEKGLLRKQILFAMEPTNDNGRC